MKRTYCDICNKEICQRHHAEKFEFHLLIKNGYPRDFKFDEVCIECRDEIFESVQQTVRKLMGKE